MKTEFEHLDDQQKLVMLAKDVLAQLDARRYTAESTYYEFKDDFGYLLSSDDLIAKELSPEKTQHFINYEVKSCSVCAIGSLIVSYISVFDGVSSSEDSKYPKSSLNS